MSPATSAAKAKKPAAKKPVKRARKPADPAKAWASYLRRYRPGLQGYVLEGLTATYGPQAWESRLDPTSELILTILTQNTADVNAEKAYEALRVAYPSDKAPRSTSTASAGAGRACPWPRRRTGWPWRTRRSPS